MDSVVIQMKIFNIEAPIKFKQFVPKISYMVMYQQAKKY